MFKSFSIKFFITYTLVTLLLFVFIYSGFNYFLSEGLRKEEINELNIENEKILEDLQNSESFRFDVIKPYLDTGFKYTNNQVFLFNMNAELLYVNSDNYDHLIGQPFNPQFLNDAYLGKIIEGITTLDHLFSKEKALVASPIFLDGRQVGVLLNTRTLPGITEITQRISLIIFIILLMILAVTFTFTYFFSMKVTKIIDAFNYTAKKIASGQLSSRVDMSYENNDVGELAKNLNNMAQELERVDSMRKEFIANISHDLRSPLTSIGGFAQAMLDGTISHDKQERYLKIILTETEHLSNLTQNILLLTQMENNIIKLEMNTFDIHNLLRKVLIQFEQPIVDKMLSVELLAPTKELDVIGDLNQIQRVIYNLLHNAIKFSSENGSLILETKIRQNKVHISIADTGPGMSKDEIKYMWIRFHKGDKSRGKDKGGFGIGLSIVREIINAHNQTIDVYSQLGKGTTFVFTLDLALDDPAQQESGKAAPSA